MKSSSKLPKILSIDTSCDETSAAVTEEVRILSNIVASQIKIHQKYGGVVPNLAKREHEKLINPIIEEALSKSQKRWEDIDAVAVTYGPGLAVALEVGISKAKEVSQRHKKPLIVVNHMEGHLLSPFAKDKKGNFGIKNPQFPALGFLVSGGHTELIFAKEVGNYKLIGQTLDDAAGEAFDKVARILNLEYPGGPEISRLAKKGDDGAFDFPVPMKKSKDFNFSFSGLKTACLYKAKDKGKMSPKEKANFAASFERVAVEHLIDKLRKAALKYKPKMILIGGGVIRNPRLQKEARREMERVGIPIHIPYNNLLLTDNAGMIGIAAYFKAQRGEFVKEEEKLDRVPNLSL